MSSELTPHVVVVDDDADIRELLTTYLSQNGFRVSTADGGVALRLQLTQDLPDAVVLDLMMPGEDGLSLTRWLKASHAHLPILMLSARGEEMDRIIGLEVGADDYLPKPFSPRELLARLRALLRRPGRPHGSEHPEASGSAAGEVLRFGDFRLYWAARLLKRQEHTIDLTTGEFELLAQMARRPHRVLSRDTLISLLKGYERDAHDRSIDNRITRLRRKIETDPVHPCYIRTVRGEGYVFNPEGDRP